ncbi:MAG: hypothetical protein ACYDH9_16170 [Limisphaerales bacterium]
MNSGLFYLAVLVATRALAVDPASTIQRSTPRPLTAHPGNVFVQGEEVIVPLPPGESDFWHAFDYEGNVVGDGRAGDSRAVLAGLPIGFYEIHRVGAAQTATNRVSFAVLAPLKTPTPLTSPVAIDVAMAWFYPKEKMPAVASLCALAGMNWVRDRLSWPEIEPKRGEFAAATRYDDSARAQRAAGLQVLQVDHISPAWANPEAKRFPLDLRDAFRFYREVARRWRGQVLAFEPWNEADIPMFGGHTGSEIATLQKAAYLGLKAGNSSITVCQNVFALHNRAILADFRENQAWPYFDTFNLHHYVPIDEFPEVYADFRAVSAGKPLWVTECSVPVKWTGDAKLEEPSDSDLRVQAERVAKIYAASLFEGSQEIFYFLLPHYAEGQTQFGVLRPDLTPRPAYVALAAAGRLLANAQPIGRFRSTNGVVRGFLFRDRRGGDRHELLVAWTTGGDARVLLPAEPLALYDYLGRERSRGGKSLELTSGPVFAILPSGSGRRMSLAPPPRPADVLPGRPSPVVLQAVWSSQWTALKSSAYRLSAEKVETIPVNVYNFSDQKVRGKLSVHSPDRWKVTLPERIELAAGERQELKMTVETFGAASAQPEQVRILGNFGRAGRPVLSLRLLSETDDGRPRQSGTR